MSQDPLEEDLALVRAAAKSRPPAIDPQRKARLWSRIDEELNPKPRRWSPFVFGLAWAGAAAIAAFAFFSARPVETPRPAEPRAEVSADVEMKNEALPKPAAGRVYAREKQTVLLTGAELELAEGAELDLNESGAIALVSGAIEVSVHSATALSFVAGEARLSAMSARFRMVRNGAQTTLEIREGEVSSAHGFDVVPAAAAENKTVEPRAEMIMAEADRARLAGKTARAIALYEQVADLRSAGAYREEALLRQAELYAASGQRDDALRALAAADARVANHLLLPERIALSVELLLAADRIDEARAMLEQGRGIESPALDRVRARFDAR